MTTPFSFFKKNNVLPSTRTPVRSVPVHSFPVTRPSSGWGKSAPSAIRAALLRVFGVPWHAPSSTAVASELHSDRPKQQEPAQEPTAQLSLEQRTKQMLAENALRNQEFRAERDQRNAQWRAELDEQTRRMRQMRAAAQRGSGAPSETNETTAGSLKHVEELTAQSRAEVDRLVELSSAEIRRLVDKSLSEIERLTHGSPDAIPPNPPVEPHHRSIPSNHSREPAPKSVSPDAEKKSQIEILFPMGLGVW